MQGIKQLGGNVFTTNYDIIIIFKKLLKHGIIFHDLFNSTYLKITHSQFFFQVTEKLNVEKGQ